MTITEALQELGSELTTLGQQIEAIPAAEQVVQTSTNDLNQAKSQVTVEQQKVDQATQELATKRGLAVETSRLLSEGFGKLADAIQTGSEINTTPDSTPAPSPADANQSQQQNPTVTPVPVV